MIPLQRHDWSAGAHRLTRAALRPAPAPAPLPAAGPCLPAPVVPAAAGARTVPQAASSRLSSASQTTQAVMAGMKPGGSRAVRKRRSSSLMQDCPPSSAHAS